MLTAAMFSNPVGVQIENRTEMLYNRTGSALVVGQVFQMDMAQAATETTTYLGTGADSAFGAAVAVDATGADAYPLVVALEATADNALGKFGIVGIFDVFVDGTDTAAVGEALHATAAAVYLDATASSGSRAVAIAMAAASDGTLQTIKALFDGTGCGVK